jgi:hypothetical protein
LVSGSNDGFIQLPKLEPGVGCVPALDFQDNNAGAAGGNEQAVGLAVAGFPVLILVTEPGTLKEEGEPFAEVTENLPLIPFPIPLRPTLSPVVELQWGLAKQSGVPDALRGANVGVE